VPRNALPWDGRNSFQRPEASAKKMLGEIMQVLAQ
jgi:hypothetical protein